MHRPLLTGLLTAAVLLAGDWPQLLGPTRNGVYTGPWSISSSFARVWTHPIGEGFSPPVIAEGRLILFHRRGNKELVESLDPATGKTQWTYAYDTHYRDDFGFSDGPRAAPAIDSGHVYTYGADAMLTCLDLKTGAKIWALDAKSEFGVRKEFFGAAPSPLIDGPRLLLNIGGANGAGIVAIDKNTGKTLWKELNSQAGYSAPTVATIAGKRHALFFTRDGLVDTDPADGRIRFQFRWRSISDSSVNAAVPLVVGNRVFISASYGTGAAVLDLSADQPKVVWSGDDSLSNHYATSVYHDGYLYGFDGRQEFGQELRAVDFATGKVMWSVPDLRAGTVTLAGTHLFVITEAGELLVAPISPKAFRPEKKVTVSPVTVRAYPALADGRMYVRSINELTCFRID